MEFNEEDTLAIGDTTKLWLDEILQERVKWLNHEVFEEYFDEDIANNETLKIIVSCTDCRDEQLRLKVYSVHTQPGEDLNPKKCAVDATYAK